MCQRHQRVYKGILGRSFADYIPLAEKIGLLLTRLPRHPRGVTEECHVFLSTVKWDKSTMDEIEQKFKGYLTDIGAWQYYEDVDYFFREATLPPLNDIHDILITNYPHDDQTVPEDLWMFYEGYCVKVKDFSKVAEEPEVIELRSLKGEVKSVHITKQNYSFLQTESRRPKEREPKPRLEISIKLGDGQTFDFKAAESANCKHLLEIYQKHFVPLFPV